MSRFMPLLIGLLLTTTGLLTIVAIFCCGNYLLTGGFATAQVQLVAAATVFGRRWLALRVLALIACLLLWTAVFAPFALQMAAINTFLLLTVALFTAAWCGILAFGGWRLEVPQSTTEPVIPRRQFSLATLLLATTIACVYGALWRWFEFSSRDYPLLMLTLMCSVAGCTMLKATARGTWPWLPLATVVSIVVVVFSLPLGSLMEEEFALLVLGVHISFLLAVLIVLRVAGIYLVNDAIVARLK